MKSYPLINLVLMAMCLSFLLGCSRGNALEEQAKAKIEQLERLMNKAKEQAIDVRREESLIWFSKEFIKFARWDEAHKDQIQKIFGYDRHYEKEAATHAEELPDFERRKVIEILDNGIAQLKAVLEGSIVRKPAPKVDWTNIEVTDQALLNKGKHIFLHDYFSKTVGIPLTNTDVYNDHLGNMYHGGEHLYEEHQDRAINPWLLNEDGTFDEARLKLLTDIPDTNIGFLYLWNSGLPEWMHQKDTSIASGRSLFMGFDIDNPLVRDHWGKIANKVGELTKDKKVTQLGFVLANEPHWFAEKGYWTQNYGEMNTISPYTKANFRAWLQEKYDNDIARLNDNWQRTFENFDTIEIQIPIDKKHRGEPMWYDWCRFSMARSLDWFTHIQNELRSTYPEAPTSIKLQPRYFMEDYRSHGLDFEALTELTSIIGDDAKAQTARTFTYNEPEFSTTPERWEERYAYSWEEVAFSYDFMESVSPNKIHFNSETHFLSLSRWKDLDLSTAYTRNVFWLATLHGMDASTSWFWARDPDGSPEDRLEGDLDFWDPGLGGAYAGSTNMQPQTVNEIAQVFMDMNSVSDAIMSLREQPRPLRLFYSETSAINKKHHMTELFELYEALYFEGLPLGYATENIIKNQDNALWEAVVVYKTPYVTDSEFKALNDYVQQGGTVLIDKESVSKNEYGEPRKERLHEGLGKLVLLEEGLSVGDITKTATAIIEDQKPKILLNEINGTSFKTCTWRVSENPEGGYFLNILNLGKTTAQLEVSKKDGSPIRCVNMLTGQNVGTSFDLNPMGVLLLAVE